MRLYDWFGMNPRLVRFFLEEKGLQVERVEVNTFAGENRRDPHLARNPAGHVPVLELDDGTCLAESWVICEYLEDRFPQPALIGATPEERARTRMWWRRAEQQVCVPALEAFCYGEGLDIFRERIYCIPHAAEALKAKARVGMRWLDEVMPAGGWLAGACFTVADISLFCYLDLLRNAGQPIPHECTRLRTWFDRVAQRPAAARSEWRERPMGLVG
ncbi:MAG TPA: glutathione S-transferase family protein [Lysobacter sp.]|nr:glutathione S-transferase family protein [Lysobacter sp.]